MVTYENSKTETDVYSNLGDRMVTYQNSKTETDVYLWLMLFIQVVSQENFRILQI